MNSIAMGIFVKEKDIALIWNQNQLPIHKGSRQIEKNRKKVLFKAQLCTASLKRAATGKAIVFNESRKT